MNLFIFITIISIIITFLYYFGIIRYLELHICNHKKYLEKYKNLDKASDKKVVISFTTTPEKVKKLKPFINSLLDQTVKVDNIVLNIPKNKEYNIPHEYNNILNIFQIGKDYGDGNKFISTVLREEDNDTIIILLEDNFIYGKDYIETILEEYEKNKCAIINNQSITVIPEFFDMDIFKRDDNKIDNNWILNNIKTDKKYFNYSENYKSIF
jgi:hypothetical protein